MAYAHHATIYHEGLNKSKTIGARSRRELEYKCAVQQAQWAEQWQHKRESDAKKAEAQRKREEKLRIANDNEKAQAYADKMTSDAEDVQRKIEGFLSDRICVPRLDFNKLKNEEPFSVEPPDKPVYIPSLREPLRSDAIFNPKPALFTKLISKRMEEFNADNERAFEESHSIWEKRQADILEKNNSTRVQYEERVAAWTRDKRQYEDDQREHNRAMDAFVEGIRESDLDVVDEFAQLLLSKIELPIDFEIEVQSGFTKENRELIVEATIPTVEDIPNLKAVSYIKSKREFKEAYFTDAQMQKKYDNFIYQLTLVILNYAFNINSYLNAVDAVVVNGIINTVDKSNGNLMCACILSVRVTRDSFSKLNLSAIDPKAWFRSAKGIAAATIANITPVQPLQILDKEDDRFIEGYQVAGSLNEGVNLAAMDWKDFENLIREIFEEEFSQNGGEVKITQASRDGGVDAVAFDPDPIRGGKIVIQAKRYTNVVGVSAVRDLYGTLINEGAMKGILVTTAYFGNDAYEFAKGKPIQLMGGQQLLGLLQGHGHKARINLEEAKKLLREEEL